MANWGRSYRSELKGRFRWLPTLNVFRTFFFDPPPEVLLQQIQKLAATFGHEPVVAGLRL